MSSRKEKKKTHTHAAGWTLAWCAPAFWFVVASLFVQRGLKVVQDRADLSDNQTGLELNLIVSSF